MPNGLNVPISASPAATQPQAQGFGAALQRALPLIALALGGLKGGQAGGALMSGFAGGRQEQQALAQRQALIDARLQEVEEQRQARAQRIKTEEATRIEQTQDTFVTEIQRRLNGAVNAVDAARILAQAEAEAASVGLTGRRLRQRVFVPRERFKQAELQDLEEMLKTIEQRFTGPEREGQTLPYKGEQISLADAYTALDLAQGLFSVPGAPPRPTFAELYPRVLQQTARPELRDLAERSVPMTQTGQPDEAKILDMLQKAGAYDTPADRAQMQEDEVERWRTRLRASVRDPDADINRGEIRRQLRRLGVVADEADWQAELSRAQRAVQDELLETAGKIERLSPQLSEFERYKEPGTPGARDRNLEIQGAIERAQRFRGQTPVRAPSGVSPPAGGWPPTGVFSEGPPPPGSFSNVPPRATDISLPSGGLVARPPPSMPKVMTRSDVRQVAQVRGMTEAEVEAEVRALGWKIID